VSGAQAANVSRAQHRPILTFMTAKRYRPQFLISSIFMLYQQFDGAPTLQPWLAAGSGYYTLSCPTWRVSPVSPCLVGREC